MLTLLFAALLSVDAAPAPPSLSARISDPAVMRSAVKTALAASDNAPAAGQALTLRSDGAGTLANKMDAARVPGCFGDDSLKHQPPVIGRFNFSGVFTLPFWLSAVVQGKCR